MPQVGVLALQGAFAAHAKAFSDVDVVEIRTPAELEQVDALVIPGGESTTISMLIERSGLLDTLKQRIDDGMPTLGTCAGMILLAADIVDGRHDQHALGSIDISVRRNAYGTQLDSFEADLHIPVLETVDDGCVGTTAAAFHGVFIRAPAVERVGADVEVLCTHNDSVVMCRSKNVLVAAFHPELSADPRLHTYFIKNL